MGKSRNLVTERFILLTLQICEGLFAKGETIHPVEISFSYIAGCTKINPC